MKDFNPTHFIEQYDLKEGYTIPGEPNFYFTRPFLLESLAETINNTRERTALKTVAIFKIQFKNNVA